MNVLLWLVACSGSAPESSVSPPGSDGEAASTYVPPTQPKKHAIVLLIDTLRFDSLAEADMPNLDGLAARGDVVSDAWSAGTWTVPSVTALFTGMPVRQHGWDLPAAMIGKYPPIPAAPTIASVLHDAGFVTAGLYANPYLAEPLGFDRGYDRWVRIADRSAPQRVQKEVATWNDGKRHFLYIHLLGAHSALKPSDEKRTKYGVDAKWIDPRIGFDIGAAKRNQDPGVQDAYRASYKAVLEDTDVIVGDILKQLEPYMADSVVIFTSDHGELLGEHTWFGHGTHVWYQLTHVPLVAVNAGDVPNYFGTAGLADVITQSVGVKHAWPTPATTTLPLVTQREGLFAISPDGHTRAVWEDKQPLQVFDIATDPGELKPIPGRDAEMEALRRDWEAKVPAGTTSLQRVELSPETLEELKQLGYVH